MFLGGKITHIIKQNWKVLSENIMKKLTKKANEMNLKELAAYIDYSVLKPKFTEKEIVELTKDGVKLGCATICINPAYIELCEPYVKGSNTMLLSCNGFSIWNKFY